MYLLSNQTLENRKVCSQHDCESFAVLAVASDIAQFVDFNSQFFCQVQNLFKESEVAKKPRRMCRGRTPLAIFAAFMLSPNASTGISGKFYLFSHGSQGSLCDWDLLVQATLLKRHMNEHSQAERQTTHLQSLRGVDVRAGLRPRTRDMRISAGRPGLRTRQCHLFRSKVAKSRTQQQQYRPFSDFLLLSSIHQSTRLLHCLSDSNLIQATLRHCQSHHRLRMEDRSNLAQTADSVYRCPTENTVSRSCPVATSPIAPG